MAYDIGPKIGIDGEAAFRKQLQDINNGLKTLGSEAKVVTSAFDGQEGSMEALTATGSVLERTLLTLREKLDAQNKMLAESAAMYGEADAKTQAWQRAVNATQTEINKLQGQIDQNNAAMAQASDATGRLTAQISQQEQQLQELQRAYSNAVLEEGKSSDSARSLQDQIKTLTGELDKNKQKLQEASGAMSDGATQGLNLSNVLSGALSVAAGNLATGGLQLLGQAVMAYADFCRDAINASTAYADSINTLAAKSDLSTETLQALTYAAELMDVPVTTVTGSMVKLTRSMDKFRDGNAEATQAFETLGLSMDTVVGPDGQLRRAEDVWNVVIDALGQIQNQTERDAISMAIFGKSAQDLNPIINIGSRGIREYADEAHAMSAVLSEEQRSALTDVDDAFVRLEQQQDAIKRQIAAELAPQLVELVKAFTELARSVDWQALAEGIVPVIEGVTELIKAVQTLVEWWGKLNNSNGLLNAGATMWDGGHSAAAKISTPSYSATKAEDPGYAERAAQAYASEFYQRWAQSQTTTKVEISLAPGSDKVLAAKVKNGNRLNGQVLAGE